MQNKYLGLRILFSVLIAALVIVTVIYRPTSIFYGVALAVIILLFFVIQYILSRRI